MRELPATGGCEQQSGGQQVGRSGYEQELAADHNMRHLLQGAPHLGNLKAMPK
jgi:hypothetical protein